MMSEAALKCIIHCQNLTLMLSTANNTQDNYKPSSQSKLFVTKHFKNIPHLLQN